MNPQDILVPLLIGAAITVVSHMWRRVRTLDRQLWDLRCDVRAAESHIRGLTPPELCRCGEMAAGKAERCPRHPEVRLRTTEEKAAFARAFDAQVSRSQRK